MTKKTRLQIWCYQLLYGSVCVSGSQNLNKKPWAMAGECADFRPIQTDYPWNMKTMVMSVDFYISLQVNWIYNVLIKQ